MALIEWSETMSVKIPSIDNQHKKLVEMTSLLSNSFITPPTHIVGKKSILN